MKINYLDIGKRIRVVRREKGITQEQLAEMIDAGITHVSHMETGNTIPSLKMFVAIVNALDISADELLCDSVVKAKGVFKNEIAKVTEDCSDQEIRVIAETVKSLKTALRKTYESGE